MSKIEEKEKNIYSVTFTDVYTLNSDFFEFSLRGFARKFEINKVSKVSGDWIDVHSERIFTDEG